MYLHIFVKVADAVVKFIYQTNQDFVLHGENLETPFSFLFVFVLFMDLNKYGCIFITAKPQKTQRVVLKEFKEFGFSLRDHATKAGRGHSSV